MKGIDCESVFIDTSSIPELQEYTISFLKLILESSLLSNGSCYIAVSGSSQPKLIGKPLSELNINWKCVYFFFVDERCVSIDDPDSSFRAWDNEFFSKVDIPRKNIFALDYPYKSTEEAAEIYDQKLHSIWNNNLPIFDIVLLGMGPDGHTCSLFPNHPLLKENEKWVCPIDDSPKPPASRITLTYPVLNNADNVFFLLTGKNKAQAVYSLMNDEPSESIPSSLVHPKGEFLFILDKEAGSLIA